MIRLALSVALLFCEAEGGVTAGARAQEPAPAAQPETTGQADFDPAVVEPSGVVRDARAALDDGDAARAAALIDATSATDATTLAELRWLRTEAAERLGDAPKQRSTLESLVEAPSPLQPWAVLRLAQTLSTDDAPRAASLAATLTGHAWAGRWRARKLEAQLLARLDPERAVPLLRALVAEADPNTGAASAGMPLAEILTGRGDEASLVEALGLYRRVAARAPLADVGRQAEALADTTLRRLPSERRRELAAPPVDLQLAQANALYGALRYREAEAAFARVADATSDAALACEALFMRAKCALRRRDREHGATRMKAVADRCQGDVQARALYAAGKALDVLGREDEAIAVYARLEQVAPAHRLADDAHLLAALARRDTGDEEGYLRDLSETAERYPSGDMSGDALFRLGLYRLSHGDAAAALSAFERMRRAPEDHAEDALGRADYWRGRALEQLGRRDEAKGTYAQLALDFPLAYYAQLGMSRLAELERGSYDEVARRLRGDASTPLRFPHRAEMDAVGFDRLLSLLRVGDLERAELELEAQGFLGEGADPDALWLAAALLNRAGDEKRATQLSRRRLRSFRRLRPTGRGMALWRLAYPRAFSPLIEDAAREAEVPAPLIRAIAREESGFDPRAVSWARAYGLVQVILPTARRFGAELHTPINPRTLRQADTNVRVGARFMRFLLRRYDGHACVLPAAYNAGHRAADRWLRARPDMPVDEWVEAIPYAETRRYTRRVLQSYGVYRFLDAGEVPLIGLTLPPAP